MNQLRNRPEDSVYPRVSHSAKIFTNIGYILDKMRRDGNLQKLQETFEEIVETEIAFAVSQLSLIEKKSKSFNMSSQLRNNLYVFKENLKVLSGFVSGLISRSSLEAEDEVGFDQPGN